MGNAYNDLNMSKTNFKVSDEKVLEKFTKRMSSIEIEKTNNLNGILNTDTLLKDIMLQQKCIKAYSDIATAEKREKYNEDMKHSQNNREQFKADLSFKSEEKNVTPYEIFGISNASIYSNSKIEEIKYNEDLKKRYIELMNKYKKEIEKELERIDKIFTYKLRESCIRRIDYSLEQQLDLTNAYRKIKTLDDRMNYEIGKITYENKGINLANPEKDLEYIKLDNSVPLELFMNGRKVFSIQYTGMIPYLDERGIPGNRLNEFLIEKYNARKHDFDKYTVYTNNDAMIAKMSSDEEYRSFALNYLFSTENLNRSEKVGNYVGIIARNKGKKMIIRDSAAEQAAKKFANQKNIEKSSKKVGER